MKARIAWISPQIPCLLCVFFDLQYVYCMDTDASDAATPSSLIYEPGHLQPFGSGRPTQPVDEISGFPNGQTFFQNYVFASKPLIMTGAAKLSPAFVLWTDEYFMSLPIPDDNTILVETKKKESRTQMTMDMHFKEFLQVYNKTEYFMVNSVPDFLRKDVLLPGCIQCEQLTKNMLVDVMMWMSSGGTKSVLHTDAADNINCIFSGEKEFVLVDPDKHWEKAYMDHPEGAYSSIDVESMDYEKYPGLAEIEYYHVKLNPGDCFFLPYRWIHHVRSEGRNLAVNIWWDHYRVQEELDPSSCHSNMDRDLTLDKVTFHGLDSMMKHVFTMRDLFLDLSRQKYNLNYSHLEAFFLLDMEGIDMSEAGEGYKIPILQIMRILDVDHDGVIRHKEVMQAEREAWDKINSELDKFDAILDVIDDRWQPLHGDDTEQDMDEQDVHFYHDYDYNDEEEGVDDLDHDHIWDRDEL